MTFLFIASIGPVQPFIASARRTRDLYAGSTLLSELSKAAARSIAEYDETRAELIFPFPLSKDQLKPGTFFNVANKIVAIVHLPGEQVKGLGSSVGAAIDRQLSDVRSKAFSEQKSWRQIDFGSNKATAKEQLANLIEYSWVAVPFNEDADHNAYEKARERAEEVLAARKNTSVFGPVTWGGEWPKSSIDGKLECVIPENMYNNSEDAVRALYEHYKAGPQERLSAVDLLKRLSAERLIKPEEGEAPHIVLSTSHIAATPFLRRLSAMDFDQQLAKEAWDKYIQQVKKLVPRPTQEEETSPILETLPLKPPGAKLPAKYLMNDVIGRYDGAILFEERLLDDRSNKDYKVFKDVQAALKKFFKTVGMSPSPYYALLIADGDGMGKAIEQHAGGPEGHQHHRELSQALSRFSQEVAGIIHGQYGCPIYAGGDDIMALLPLDTVLTCTRTLAQKFAESLQKFAYLEKDKHGNETEKHPTLSAGIAIVHHVSLLDEALELARFAEKQAKKQKQKNSLAIIIRKRSGEDYPVVVSWETEKATEPAPGSLRLCYEHLQELIKFYQQGWLPKGTAYELRAMVLRLQPSGEDEQSQMLKKIIQIDAARILRRKLMLVDHPTSKARKEAEDALIRLLQLIGVRKDENNAFQVDHVASINPFINALIVAQSLAEPVEEEPKGKEPSGE